MIHEEIWIHNGDQLVKKVWLRLKEFGSQAPHYVLQLLGGVARSAIPRLGLPPANKQQKLSGDHTSNI